MHHVVGVKSDLLKPAEETYSRHAETKAATVIDQWTFGSSCLLKLSRAEMLYCSEFH